MSRTWINAHVCSRRPNNAPQRRRLLTVRGGPKTSHIYGRCLAGFSGAVDTDWVVYAKRPFASPEQVLSYLARYTHRIAIANSRLIAFDGKLVTFKVKDYRKDGAARYGAMTLDGPEFIRRLLLHVLPDGFHRIRHYGLLANGARAENIAKARELLDVEPTSPTPTPNKPDAPPEPKSCPCCGGRLILIEAIERWKTPQQRANPTPTWCDTS